MITTYNNDDIGNNLSRLNNEDKSIHRKEKNNSKKFKKN